MPKANNSSSDLTRHLAWSYPGEQEAVKGFPWGPHKLPLVFETEGLTLEVKRCPEGFNYCREGAGESIQKLVLADKGSLLLSPVEPLHKPSLVAAHLYVEFERPAVVEPRTSKAVFATFPLEIAVAVEGRKTGNNIIDVFTLSRPKYTLYGNIKDGLICKYWKSEVYTVFPNANPIKEGVLKIEIQNPTARWTEVKKAVLSAYGMKIYHSPQMVSLNAAMKIINEIAAETSFLDKPLKAGMKKSFEKFSAKLLSQMGRTVMEEGY